MSVSKNRMRSILTSLFCVLVFVAMLWPQVPVHAADNDAGGDIKYYDGTYEGTARGYKSDIKVEVTITNGAISHVEVLEHNETDSYWAKLFDGDKNTLIESIISSQSTDVDGVSGATKSSNGIKGAVTAALEKAAVDPNGWYDSGEGTAAKPYIIKTAEQLERFALAVDNGETLAGKYVALGADIDLAQIDNWNPIGTEGATASATKFAGTFDGKGHTVSNMTIAQEGLTAETNVGLFAALDSSAAVRNLNISNAKIGVKGNGVLRAGGIAGDTVNGSETAGTDFDKISVTGIISADSTGTALVFAGGIAGRAMTFVKASNSWTDVDTTAISRGGNNSGYAGGIFGMSGNNSLIVNVATFGDSYGNSPKSTNFGGMAGGLGGMLASKTYNVYSTGNATVGNSGTNHKWVGALAGEYPTGGMTKLDDGSYAYPETGAFRDFGYYPSDAVLTIEKWAGENKTSETAELRAVGTSPTMSTHDKIFEDKCTAMDRADMSAQGFADTLNGNLKETRRLLDAYGYTAVDINNWELVDGKVLPTGSKWVSKDPDPSIFAGGTGTADDPYQIKSEGQIRAFADSLTEGIDYNGYFVKVMNDIDISSADWSPIGGQDFAFDGTFDGGGHNISGMKAGTKDEPYAMGRDNPYMGFFGVLGKNAVVRDVKLTDVEIYAATPQYVYLGGIAAINDAGSDSKAAMIIDGCSVTGRLTAVADKSNAFVGGIIASQYKGAVINCMTDMDLSCTVKTGNAIAEVGGLVALNNRGLVANSYSLGNVWGSASRNNGDEGMASTGNLVGVNAGDLVGCYSKGDNTTAEYSVYAGELTGWITGIGKVYSCYYNKEARMTIDGRDVVPPADFGTKVAPGVNEEGDAYVGGIVDELVGYTADEHRAIADKLNAKFTEYPIDISIYGMKGAMLRKWTYDGNTGHVILDTDKAETTYKQPAAEIVPPDVEELHDGTWYGRDDQKKVVVKIVTESNDVVSEEVVSGDDTDKEAYDAAVTRARTKALYGDATGYGSADASLFAGGKGTKEDPYLISNEQQLRAIAEALNEDETFADVYFKQTADIDVSSEDWMPIGHGIMAKVKKAWTQVAAYPFLGNYDGDSFSINGLKIGSEDDPSSDPRVNFTAGLFGFVSGDHYSNDKITDDVRITRLENIKLRDVDINVTSDGQNYNGGLVGNAQNGFLIDNCSVTGKVSSYSKGSFARGAGIAGNVIRGTVLNSWTDVDVKAETDAGNTYAGGLYSIDNRVTSINCYSLGTVTGNAAANNKVHIGGISGQAGGVHYNCYTAGDVTSLKTTSDAGLAEGRLAGIAVDSKVYYNSDAKLTVAGTVKDPAPVGVSMPEDPDITPKTAAEMGSEGFADLLNKNAEAASKDVDSLQNIIDSQTDLMHVVQFSGNAEELSKWISAEGKAVLLDKNLIRKADEEEARRKAEEEARKKAEEEARRQAEEAKAKAEAAKYADKDAITPSDATIEEKAGTDKKLDINPGAISTAGKVRKKAMTVKWKKVSDATNYRIAYKKAGTNKWTYKWSAGKTSVKLTGLKAKGLYDFKLQAVRKSGSTWTKANWTKTNYSYFASTGRKVKAGKKSITVKAGKVKGATGYQVLCATKKNMKDSKIKSGKKPTIKLTKLKKGKKYFVQARPVKKYKGKLYLGILSPKKAVKVK